jgi:hypothetical protein
MLLEQHRVDGHLAHALDLSFTVPDCQVRIHLRYILGYQAILHALAGIDLLLETLGGWIEPIECFASLVHWLDVL